MLTGLPSAEKNSRSATSTKTRIKTNDLLNMGMVLPYSQCILASLILGCTSANQARLFAFGLH